MPWRWLSVVHWVFEELPPGMASRDSSRPEGRQKAMLTSLPSEIRDLIWKMAAEECFAGWDGFIWPRGTTLEGGRQWMCWGLVYTSREVSAEFRWRFFEEKWFGVFACRLESAGIGSDGGRRIPQGVFGRTRQLRVNVDLYEEYEPWEAAEMMRRATDGLRSLLGRFERLGHVLIVAWIDGRGGYDEGPKRDALGALRELALSLEWRGAEAFAVRTASGDEEMTLHWRDGGSPRDAEGCRGGGALAGNPKPCWCRGAWAFRFWDFAV